MTHSQNNGSGPPDSIQQQIDILADAENPIANVSDHQHAVTLANEMRQIELQLYNLKIQADLLSSRYDKIQLEVLPNLLLSIGMRKFSLDSGDIIEVKDFIRGSIPTLNAINAAPEEDRAALEDRRNKSIAWLKANNAESIIKNQVIALFGKGQGADAEAVYLALKQEGYVVKKEEEINFQTLQALLRTKVAEGASIPAEAFALFVGKKAELKKAK